MRRVVLAFLMSMFATALFAQGKPLQLPDPQPPSPTPVPPHCTDFKRNPDGSWSPVHSVTVGDVTISKVATFLPGSHVSGVDLATLLDQQCLQQP